MATEIDPVCGMEVDTDLTDLKLEHDGKTYHFCCDGCPSQFAKLSDEEKKEKAVAAAKKETGS